MTTRTLVQGLRRAAERNADKPAVVTPGRTLSYSELDGAADRVAGGLRELQDTRRRSDAASSDRHRSGARW